MPDQCASQCRGIAEHLLLERLVNDAPIPIAVVEGDELRFVKANPAYCALGGNPEAELVGRTMAEVFPDAAAHGSLEPHKHAMRTGERISQKELEFYVRASPESPPEPTWWNVTLVPLDGEAERPAVLIMAEDVTAEVLARRHAEEQAAELREREEWLRMAMDAAKAGLWSLDLTTHEAQMTDRGLVMHGLLPGARIDLSGILAAIHPEDRGWMNAEAERVMEQQRAFRLEYRALWPDGTVRWILSQAEVSSGPKGPRFVGLVQDISERKQADERLSQLATVTEGSSDFVGIAGLDHQAVYLNPAGQAMVGLEGDEAVRATRVEDYFFPEDLPRVRDTILPTVMREGRWKGEVRFRHFQTGEPIAVDWDVFRVDDPRTGQPVTLVTVTRDIRPQKAAEQAMRESEEMLRLAEHAGNTGSFEWNPQTDRLRLSPGCQVIYGHEAEAYDGTREAWVRRLRSNDRWQVERLINQAFADRKTIAKDEFQIVRPDGQARWLEGRILITYDGEGNPVRVVGVKVDITDRKRAEERLKALNDTLEQRVVERTAIAEQRAAQLRVLAAELTEAEEQERRRLAKILHDHLQQLLVAARIKTAVLRRRAEDDNFLRTLEQIDDVLNQAITESRSLTVELSPPVLYDAGLAAGLDWLARQIEEKHGLRVEVDADPAAEPTDESTRVFLFQTVRELLLNVVKHAQTDLARVELKPLGEDRLRLIVADAGVGFELSALESQGMSGGFGLFSIRERLELLGGHLAVEASPGGGTRMMVDIPRGRAAVAAGVTPMETAVAIGEAEGEEPRPPSRHEKTRVVLADDHAIVRQGLAGLLREQEAIEVVGEAADGRQAVEITLQTRPDVVLMDVTMPGLNGVEATRRILSSLPQVRVIGLSMHEAADMANAMRKAGAVAYLRKDTDSDVLVSMIQAQASAVQEHRVPDA